MPIHITPHHLTLSPALRDFVFEKIGAVARFASDLLSAEVVLRRHEGSGGGKRFSATARLAVPGKDVHGTAEHSDLYTAITQLASRLGRRSRKRKTRLARSQHGW
jgi:putative sigma-54 modulation protein